MDSQNLLRSIVLIPILGLIAAMGQEVRGQEIYAAQCSNRYAPCADGICLPRLASFGYTPQQWSRWPGDSEGPDAIPGGTQNRDDVPWQIPPDPSEETAPSPQNPVSQIPNANLNHFPRTPTDNAPEMSADLTRLAPPPLAPSMDSYAPIYPSPGFENRESYILDTERGNALQHNPAEIVTLSDGGSQNYSYDRERSNQLSSGGGQTGIQRGSPPSINVSSNRLDSEARRRNPLR